MNMKINEKDTLEELLDRHGMETILDALAQICHEKSEHCQTNWQCPELAKRWLSAGIKLDLVKITKPISAISN